MAICHEHEREDWTACCTSVLSGRSKRVDDVSCMLEMGRYWSVVGDRGNGWNEKWQLDATPWTGSGFSSFNWQSVLDVGLSSQHIPSTSAERRRCGRQQPSPSSIAPLAPEEQNDSESLNAKAVW
jgi:hypothetical protein